MDATVVLELFQTFATWRQQNPDYDAYLPIGHSHLHVCTRDCQVVGIRNAFVCVASGRTHVCDPANCPLMLSHVEGRSCPVSGYLDRTEVYSDNVGDQIERCKRGMGELARKRKRDDDRTERNSELPLRQVLQTIRQLCVSDERRVADDARKATLHRRISHACRRYREQQISNNKPVELLYLVSVVSTESYSPPPRPPLTRNSDVLVRYARIVLTYWNHLQPFIGKQKYTLAFHTLATLYALKDGMTERDEQILQRHVELEYLLPHINDVDAIGFVKRKLTRHLEMFRKAYVLYHHSTLLDPNPRDVPQSTYQHVLCAKRRRKH